MKVRDSIT